MVCESGIDRVLVADAGAAMASHEVIVVAVQAVKLVYAKSTSKYLSNDSKLGEGRCIIPVSISTCCWCQILKTWRERHSGVQRKVGTS
jgi:hypothetical protein